MRLRFKRRNQAAVSGPMAPFLARKKCVDRRRAKGRTMKMAHVTARQCGRTPESNPARGHRLSYPSGDGSIPNPPTRRPSRLAIAVKALIMPLLFLSVTAGAQAGDDVAEAGGPPTEVSMTQTGAVRMHLVDEPLANVLHLLSLEGKRNIITSPNVKGTVTANLYDVTFEEALQAILMQNGADFRVVDKFIYIYTKDELAEIEAAPSARPFPRVYHLNYISAQDASTMIAALLAEEETVVSPPAPGRGLKSDAEDAGGNAAAMQDFVLVTARAKTHETVQAVLRDIDVRPKQALIEATILRAALTDDNALGIDFSLVGGVDLELMGAQSVGLAGITLGNLPQDRFERFNAGARTDLTGNLPPGGLTVGIIKDNVAIFLRALEEVTDITVLANPKVLALNRQKGQVIVGRRDGYLTTMVTETQAIQTVQFLETGTQLLFRPFIGDDGFIRVELHPEDSVGFVNAQGLPSEQTTEVTTNVIVRDGETILIGGLFRELTTNARSQVPGLGSLPGIGVLFQSRSDSTAREEVIILLTIHIVKDYEAYAKESREMFENVERLRVGVREGLMWHGRERLAQAQYRKALEAQRRGDTAKALWHTDLSLHNHSRFLPAIQMKENILAQRAWDNDGAGARTFLHELIARERGYRLPLFERPPPEAPPANESREGTPDGADEDS